MFIIAYIKFITTTEWSVLINNNAEFNGLKAALSPQRLHTTLMREQLYLFVWLLSSCEKVLMGTAIPFGLGARSHKLHKCFVKMKSFVRSCPIRGEKHHYSLRWGS